MNEYNNRREKGEAIAEALYGAMPQVRGGGSDILEDSRDHIFGEIWSREGLDLKHRCIVTLSALVALGQSEQIRSLVQGSLRMGWTAEELREVMLHLSYYVGFPRSTTAMGVLQDVLDEADET